MYEIKHERGTVTYALKTGKCFVKTKMPIAYAKSLVKKGRDVKETDERGCGIEICVNDKYFFPIVEKVEKPVDEVTE